MTDCSAPKGDDLTHDDTNDSSLQFAYKLILKKGVGRGLKQIQYEVNE